MTLILLIPTKDGLVVASDGQATSISVSRAGGVTRYKGQYKKIHKLNENCVWCATTDYLPIVEHVKKRIDSLNEKEKSLKALHATLLGLIFDCANELFTNPSLPHFSPPPKISTHSATFLFIEYRDSPNILSVEETGNWDWLDNEKPHAIGSGFPFFKALVQKYEKGL